MSSGRRPDIDRSPFRDEIRMLLKNKGRSHDPTYDELREQILERYGEEFTVRQLRDYMNKEILPEEMMPAKEAQQELEKRRETIDIAAKRQDLVELQESRLGKAVETEEQMGGMLLDQVNEQIVLKDKLLESLSKDYERLGVLQSTSQIDIDVNQVQADPFSKMLAESLEIELADPSDDEHSDYRDDDDIRNLAESDDEYDEGEEEDAWMDKDPDEITFDDLPDE
ncbi:hypothetical protein HUG10_21330 (plasmid) [Halorarum halophilum]|uniref:Uncharacterized protein n=1 Tax=Halorarum halophilum TaxID=2743090 RepID=A0A7D5GEZ0_9EURY|nr:hypothetical protein [Halobaculum halophilum]QLG30132.1 hypothetical protein HUG10_21330 [Halobaculum halophilum]